MSRIPDYQMRRMAKTVVEKTKNLPDGWDDEFCELTKDPEFARLHAMVCNALRERGIEFFTRVPQP